MIINLHLVIKTLTSYNDNYNLYQSSYVRWWKRKINALTNMGHLLLFGPTLLRPPNTVKQLTMYLSN
jgi:hypothetical protein